MTSNSVSKNWQSVCERIDRASLESGRENSSVKVVAVTKKQPISKITQCLEIGINCFGENYVQEALEKQSAIGLKNKEVKWHFIGALQSKKVKDILGAFELWHGVDRLSVVEELHKRCQDTPQKILLQINVANEDSKSGLREEELPQFLQLAQKMSGFQIIGLMTMPPLAADQSSSRKYFAKLREISEKYSGELEKEHRFSELSMGTSQDFESAILEGATMVRLGSVLLGERSNG